MTKQLWKNFDNFYGNDTSAPEAAHAAEFPADVTAAVSDMRDLMALKEQHPEGEETHDSDGESITDLRQVLPAFSRRGFLKLTGAASVFGMTGCWHQAPETLVPYLHQPENAPLGTGIYYSSVIRNQGFESAVMVKTYDGRPIKLEGNPDSPFDKGTLDIRGQAALLDLYDPDRRMILADADAGIDAGADVKAAQDGAHVRSEDAGMQFQADWNAADALVGAALKEGVVGLITGPWTGPSRERFAVELQGVFGDRLQQVAYHPYAQDTARQARALSYGAAAAHDPLYHADQADVMICFGSDFIGGGTNTLTDLVDFGEQRRVKGIAPHASMSQLIVFEATVSQTGTSADIRSRVSMDNMSDFAWYIAQAVASQLGKAFPAEAQAAAQRGQAIALEEHPAVAQGVAAYAIEQLLATARAHKHSLVYVGGACHSGSQSLGLFMAANYLNSILGNEGVTVEAPAQAHAPSYDATTALLTAAAAGNVATLIFADVNIAYDYADQALLKKAIATAKTVVVLADRMNETASLDGVDVLMPTLHSLEAWGDSSPRGGVYYVQQPCIVPLWNARALEESLMAYVAASGVSKAFTTKKEAGVRSFVSRVEQQALWYAPAHGVRSWRSFVEATWKQHIHSTVGAAASADAFWKSALSRGVVVGKLAKVSQTSAFNTQSVTAAMLASSATPSPAGALKLVLSASRIMGDGSQANNALLQESADPVSRNSWDNYLALSLQDAYAAQLDQHQVVKVTVGTQSLHMPIHIQPGTQPGTAEMFLGWGRSAAGAVAHESGVRPEEHANGFALAGDRNFWGIDAHIEKTEEYYKLACQQGHDYMDGRDIALDDVLESHNQDPAQHQRGHHHSLWEDGKGTTSIDSQNIDSNNLSLWSSTHIYPGRRWGMAIDMNSCTGCNACVVACSIENNVPVVGRDQVRLGREMHWIRIDRYYSTPVMDESRLKDKAESDIVEGEGFYGEQSAPDDHFIEFIQQPMLCQQCGHASCEEVCPAMATMHNEEGVNIQVYNRCIGTRYCANNCPYKVRRFNFYEYSKYRFGPQGSRDPLTRVVKNLATDLQTSGQHEMLEQPLQMMLNPKITVRSKGIMEKCNFCLSRARDIRETEKRSNKKYDESTMTTACAQTCPTQAITFGDINDPDSTVSQVIQNHDHGYRVLDKELNMRPSITYLRRIRNRPALAAEYNVHEAIEAHGHGAHAAHGNDAHAEEITGGAH